MTEIRELNELGAVQVSHNATTFVGKVRTGDDE
jgi:hypothetical protein